LPRPFSFGSCALRPRWLLLDEAGRLSLGYLAGQMLCGYSLLAPTFCFSLKGIEHLREGGNVGVNPAHPDTLKISYGNHDCRDEDRIDEKCFEDLQG